MKNRICAIIFLVIYCILSLLIIGWDLKTSLKKSGVEIAENILYNNDDEEGCSNELINKEDGYTIEVSFESSEIEVVDKKSNEFSSKTYDETNSGTRTHIGHCRLTIYTPYETHHGYNTATGVPSQHLMTCAVDPKLIPYGSNVILIKPDGTEHRLKAVDCGNFKGKMIDVFFDGSVSGGVEWLVATFGSEYADVWIEKN